MRFRRKAYIIATTLGVLLAVSGIAVYGSHASAAPEKRDDHKVVHHKHKKHKKSVTHHSVSSTPQPTTTPAPATIAPTPTTIPTQPSIPIPTNTPSKLPSQILNLTNWKIALPIDTAHPGSPDEMSSAELSSFTLAPYFISAPDNNGVIFQANAGGATTKNSNYPRSELREMTNQGQAEASWSNASGTHTMTVREAITHLPTAKPQVVAAQIHNATDDVIMIRLEGQHLFVESAGNNIGDLDTAYVLGTPYTARIVAESGRIKVYYNDTLKVDFAKSGSNYYFKAGCYTQSNTTKGDSADAYGQVIIYSLDVTHV